MLYIDVTHHESKNKPKCVCVIGNWLYICGCFYMYCVFSHAIFVHRVVTRYVNNINALPLRIQNSMELRWIGLALGWFGRVSKQVGLVSRCHRTRVFTYSAYCADQRQPFPSLAHIVFRFLWIASIAHTQQRWYKHILYYRTEYIKTTTINVRLTEA